MDEVLRTPEDIKSYFEWARQESRYRDALEFENIPIAARLSN